MDYSIYTLALQTAVCRLGHKVNDSRHKNMDKRANELHIYEQGFEGACQICGRARRSVSHVLKEEQTTEHYNAFIAPGEIKYKKKLRKYASYQNHLNRKYH